ncbi:hypothetical protein [Virgibacillus necropolis]|uniref:Uncharacterized protein n=1 Tax=Virgibacillus necropolis TaxID=163877 RepID=A0A221MGU1_9BACI|nr:hypothetical protein [Virgibacillus necropolis]ASN06883.1 hypothetical protein CFK40_18645 [Virgibacillus necropolis]
MGRQIKGLLYFFITDIRYSLMIFWAILLSILVVSLTFAYFLLSVEDGEFYFGFPFGVYIYCAILGFLTIKESIPFSIKMGATRKNLFVSIGLFFLGLAFAKAVLANTVQSITLLFTESTGIHTFKFLHPVVLLQDTWVNRVIIDTSIMFFLLAFMSIIGLLFFKHGLAGGGIVAGTIAVVLLIGVAQGWIFDFFVNLLPTIGLEFFYQLLVIGIVIYCLSFLFLRRITIVKVK